ncbi:MAG: hypothetical protein CL591_12425 [Alteromonas sp.]|nr:hypothetical protein [Alteromonas sp.]HBT08342.1 hypothetical protein [Leeuwenhoekiella sp.]|tara:strand:- start:490 stop:789 length:300 start_codon:yes stop_codon:yes gene_type:complete
MKSEGDIWVSIRKIGLMFGIISIFLLLYLFTQFYELYKLYDYYHFDVSNQYIVDRFKYRAAPIHEKIGKTLLFLFVTGSMTYYFLKKGEAVAKILSKKG